MDEADIANDTAERELARREHATRLAAANIPTGTPGDCDLCGEWSGRLVGGACAPCRDARHLPSSRPPPPTAAELEAAGQLRLLP